MSTKVKERLKKLMLELNHEERQMLDKALEHLASKIGIVTKEKPCDAIIENIPDEKLRELVAKIKKRKKKQAEMMIEA